MSVLIKGVDMPSGCAMCLLNNDSRCRAISLCDYDESNGSERRADCPLVEVPTPHGRLIDADEMKDYMLNISEQPQRLSLKLSNSYMSSRLKSEAFRKMMANIAFAIAEDMEKNMPTVIEAED